MRRTLFWILISLVTFALGLTTAFFWLNRFNLTNAKLDTASLPSQRSDIATEQPILAFCELVNNPDKYDGKIVRISAKLHISKYGHWFLDKNCYDKEKGVVVLFNTVEQETETINKIVEETKPEQNSHCDTEIITIGEFSRVKEINDTNSSIKSFPFQFKVQKVEKVSR